MKKKFYILLILCLLVNCILYAQLSRVWATYYGQYNQGNATLVTASAYDPHSGYVYISGCTSDTSGIATPGSFKSSLHNNGIPQNSYERDLFLAKFDTLGNRIWATYYGGDEDESISSIALDNSGNIYLASFTQSASGIATPGSYQPVCYTTNATYVPFLVKFNSEGERLWATYYGNNINYNTVVPGIACDMRTNCVYMVATTTDTEGIATPGSFKEFMSPFTPSPYINIQDDGFLVKFDSSGTRQWGTYYGGGGIDLLNALYVDNAGNLYAAGSTTSDSGIATAGADQTSLGSSMNAFLVKFDEAGQRLWGTYIGAGGSTEGMSVIGSGKDDIYVNGLTWSDSFLTTANCYQDSNAGGVDMFLIKYNESGTKLWSTYYGGDGNDPSYAAYYRGKSLALDRDGNILMVGTTTSSQGIEKGCALYPAIHHDGFITKWQPSGNLLWGSYYDALLSSVTTGPDASFYVTGDSSYDSLATSNALQSTKAAGSPSGIITKFTDDFACPDLSFTIDTNDNQLSVDSGYATYQWYKNGNPVSGALQPAYASGMDSGEFYVIITDSCGCIYSSDTITLHHQGTAVNTIFENNISICLYPNPNNGWFHLSGNLPDGTNRTVNFEITDILGRTIKTATFSVNDKHFNQKLDYSYLEKGVYFIRLYRNNASGIIKFTKAQ